jgi:hypothetical protein
MQGISWLAEELLAFKEVLAFSELFCYFIPLRFMYPMEYSMNYFSSQDTKFHTKTNKE